MSEIRDALLDGFGSLGSIFEPAIRPGSQDNLIQDSWTDYRTAAHSSRTTVSRSLSSALAGLIGQIVAVVPSDESLDNGSVLLRFPDGSILRADYWRLFTDGRAWLSSFDHRQKYGLPEATDAVRKLQAQLEGRTLTRADLDVESGDLVLEFAPNLRFQALKFTGYEVWEIRLPDGIGEYSNSV